MGEMYESSREEREIAGLRRELAVVKNEVVRLLERAEKAEGELAEARAAEAKLRALVSWITGACIDGQDGSAVRAQTVLAGISAAIHRALYLDAWRHQENPDAQ